MTEIKPSSTPIGRAAGFERGVVVLLGALSLLVGAAVLVVGSGVLGVFRARRPVADPLLVQWLRDNAQLAAGVGLVLGALLFVLGLWWLVRALRPEERPDVRLEHSDTGDLHVTSAALANAVRTDAEQVSGVQRARVRMAGSERSPSLRLTLSLKEGTNVRHVWEELDEKVLSRARRALGRETLPTAIRLRLDRAPKQRVR
ncbi:alkaline shock response membrane anchor protein AmaP [Saccharopolyspora rhizosphaerae]|uniref:Alkaline shock response membrane anchor protein AmaP n=1 Tax=Saccharopolyspora rhizosphaerae TaxID=2492662 RepID=A0A426JNS8_9PSEU|nr:alkaline shock response membrane anchor protein AmaP [Saccharopolyspora rhizosphaerae]RRO14791.1 alkaline shock response membrane anchor protein AmaP [Saccharopolyspora rhizosphaerae]